MAIVILLSVVTATMLFGLLDDPSPAPTARFDIADDECGYDIRHVAGDRIDGDRVEIQGVDDPEALSGRAFTAGDIQRLEATDDRIELVWTAPDAGETYVIGEFEVDDNRSGGWGCPGTVYTAEAQDIDTVEGDEGAVTTLSATGDAQALGPAGSDLTGDGTDDIPFVDSGGTIRLTNSSNGTMTITDSSAISGDIAHDKTRLGVGTWNGSDESVFFVDENHDTLYRVTPSGSPVTVATPGNGVQAVSGTGDIDGDGTDELIFADASQQLRYLEPGGTTKNVENGQTGSNDGIGSGTVADFDDDGTVSVAAVDGSNDVKIAGESTSDGGEGTTIVTAADATKAPPTVADVDGDGTGEVVYVGLSDGKLKYVDDVRGGNQIRYLNDENGTRIDGSGETGLV